jgi:hypothetical protein
MRKCSLFQNNLHGAFSLALMLVVAMPGSQANLIGNGSFETNPGVKQTTGWDAVPPWSTGGVASDSGVEMQASTQDGVWSAFSWGSDAAAGLYANQLTSHVIQAGEEFVLSLYGRPLFTFTESWGEANATLHWWMWADTSANVISDGYFDLGIGNGGDVTYSFHQSPPVSGAGYEGSLIGISVANSSGGLFGDPAGATPAFPAQSWAGFDLVELQIVPEPATGSLLLLASMGLLFKRR